MSDSPYTYDNGTLINLYGIEDDERLEKVESDFAAMRRLQLQVGLGPKGDFDLAHLKALHHHLFQDTYEWAGKTRGEPTIIEGREFMPPPSLGKEDTQFARADEIAPRLGSVFERLRQDEQLRFTNRAEFAEKGARLLADLNEVHPFREGNGRTQREFLSQLGAQAGHRLDWAAVTQERMRVDSIAAARGDLEGFRAMFREITDRSLSLMLRETMQQLARQGTDPNAIYLGATQPGRTYEGQIVGQPSPKLALIVTEDRKLLVTPSGSLRGAEVTGGGVRFTAGRQHGREMEM